VTSMHRDPERPHPHPPLERLEAIAAGDEDGEARVHAASCPACAGYVAALERRAQAFRERPDAEGPLRRAIARTRGDLRSRRRARVWTVAGPLLAAAAVLLFVRGRQAPTEVSSRVDTASSPSGSGDVRFKGELSVAAIRARAARQDRLVGSFGVRAGDAVRVEVSVDQEGPLTAGLLTDEGEWVVLLAPAVLTAGTHYSEESVRFDASPTRATLLVGDPSAVQRARGSRDFKGLIAWRVTSEP
jgi:hypothetical protein